jgi:3-phenylpropionate/cinnamic acid dioxygenase small subunit
MSAAKGPASRFDGEATALIYEEALLIDEKRWPEWLDLYTEDAVFWMPAWRSESETNQDPEYELNLLYLKGRAGLEDRVFRIDSGESFASVPLDRTTHVVGNVLVHDGEAGVLCAVASWIVHTYGSHGSTTRSGRYDYRLRRTAAGLRIAQKKITMIDDRLEGAVDVYHV